MNLSELNRKHWQRCDVKFGSRRQAMVGHGRKTLKYLKWGAGFVALILATGIGGALLDLNARWSRLPSKQAIRDYYHSQQSGGTNAEFVRIDGLPHHVQMALHAAEDSFYLTQGRDWGKCLWVGLMRPSDHGCSADFPEHLSLIVMRDLEPGRRYHSLDRLLLSWQIEAALTRQQVVELVLNRGYFAIGSHGISAASDRYFGKPAIGLTVSEAALIAGLLKAPTLFNPVDNPLSARRRRDAVLSKMLKRGMISEREWEASAASAPVY